MNTRTAFGLGIVAGLILASISLVGLIFSWRDPLMPAVLPGADQNSPQAQTEVEKQVDTLSQRVTKLERDQAFTLRDIAWRMDQKLFYLASMALVISGVAAFFGYRTYKDLDGTIREKVKATLDKELYQLDPTMLRIFVRQEEGMEKIWRRLELSGLHNLHWFNDFSKSNRRGVTIVPIRGKEDEQEYVKAIRSLKPEPSQAAFILYAPEKGHFVDPKTLDAYENVSTANMPATVINAVLAVGRGLKPEVEQN